MPEVPNQMYKRQKFSCFHILRKTKQKKKSDVFLKQSKEND